MQQKEPLKVRIPRDRLKGYKSRPIVLGNDRTKAIKQPIILKANPILPIVNAKTLDTSQNIKSNKDTFPTPKNKNQKMHLSLPGFLVNYNKINKKVIYVFAVLVCFSAILANLAYFINNKQTSQQAFAAVTSDQNDQNGQNQNGPDVNEDPIDINTINSYVVAPDMPKKITIDSIGLSARILRMGVESNNQIQSPRSSYDTGWYEGSNKPNENGLMFINGHVSGPTKPGIFYNLKKLNAGDIITIEKGDGTLIKYQVVSKETLDLNNVDMQKTLRSIDVDKQGLNLMTCSGDYSAQSNTFNERLIVYSVRI